MTPDLFIVGGGPAGLAAAIAARLRGLTVTVADPARPPIDKACGEGIMPDGVAAAQALGITLEGSAARPFRGIRFRQGDAGPVAEAQFPRGCGLALRRTALHEILIQRASDVGVRLCWGARIGGLDEIRAQWVVGADGENSRVRQWAGLDRCKRNARRYGVRRHYQAAPWTDCVEIVWGDRFQLYLTPVAANEICAALISGDSRLRIDDALARFPTLSRRLGPPAGPVRGAITATRSLLSVARGRVALIGDASGSVDAVTGEGLCLAFRQAEALADALAAGDLADYGAAHRRLARRPRLMADLMLLLGRWTAPRTAIFRAFAARPAVFARLLSLHLGESGHPDEGVRAAA